MKNFKDFDTFMIRIFLSGFPDYIPLIIFEQSENVFFKLCFYFKIKKTLYRYEKD